MNQNLLVRPFHPNDDVAAITALLHAAYAPLAAMGLNYLASHQDDDMTLRRLTQGWPFIGELGGKLVATITLCGSDPDSPCNWYRQPHVFTIGQFAVLPSMQKNSMGTQLMQMVEHEASQHGATELALDTSENALHLCRWYQRLGYRFIQHVSWNDTNYRSVVLSKTLARYSSKIK